jgi:DnaK suppressor protein
MGHRHVDIERIADRLTRRRQQIVEFLKRLDDETQELDTDSVQDIGDRSVLSISKESLFERNSQQRIVLRMVEAALARISDGAFGVCASCGDDISARRLEALPWTQYCLRCQEALEDEERCSSSTQSPLPTAYTRQD